MNHWDEQNILLPYSKTEQKSTRAAKRKLKKILSACWNFRIGKCGNLFLSVDRLKPLSWPHLGKNCFFLQYSPWMYRWDEQYILLSSSKTESNCTRAAKRRLMKILSARWNFRSSNCCNLFLSVDRLKTLFWSHLGRNCLFLKNPP